MSSNQWQGRGGKGDYGGSSSKKRKANIENNQVSSSSASTSHSSANKKPRGAPQPKQNTAIYVTGLPPDATVDDVHELFSRKCGVVAEEIDSGKPRIKLYTDSEGNPKGDALIVFFKPQSVEMAMMLLDDTTFHFGDTTSEPMRIQPADSTYKKTQYVEEGAGDENASSNTPLEGSGSDVPAAAGEPEQGAGKKKIRTEKEKAKIKAKAQKMNEKLADWSDDEPYYAEQQQKKQAGRWDKVVILKHMFTLQELDEDPTAILDIKEDIRDECAKLGEVTNVVLFDLEPEGIVSVKFTDVDAAEACVNLMNGRNFGGQAVEASIATGKERFKQSKQKQTVDSDEEDED